MGNPVADPSHPFWDVMKQAIGTPENTPGKQPAISGIPAYEDGGYVHGKAYDTDGTPIYDVGRPGLGGAIHDLVDSLTHGGVSRAQKIAADNTARRVNTNETGKPDGYANGGVVAPSEPSTRHGPDHDKTVHYSAIAPDPEGNLRRMDNWSARAALGDDKVRKLIAVDRANGYEHGGYVDVPHADDITRPSVSSAVAIGGAMGHNVSEANQQRDAEAAQEAGIEPDTTPDPNAGKPGLLSQVGQTIGHPIRAVRKAVTDLADFLGHPDNNHTRNQAIDVPVAATPTAGPAAADAAAAPAAAIPTDKPPAAAPAADANKLLSPDLSKTPAPTPEAAVVQGAAPKTAAIPTTVQQASQEAKAGAPTAHSLTPDFWNGVHQRAIHAAHLAAKAGLNPKEVYDNSMAMAVTHMQGQVMRSYGAAYNALQANNMDLVKRSLNDANFYLPNGKELEFSTNPQTKSLQVRNPFIGLPGHEKDPPMMDITPENISLMATAQLHPETFHTELAAFSKAETDAKKDAIEGQAKLETSAAAMGRAHAMNTRADAQAAGQRVLNYLHAAQGRWYERRSPGGPANGQKAITLSQYRQAAQDAAKAVDDNALGPLTVGPITGPDGQPNLSPSAGKTFRDPTKVAPDFAGYSPGEVLEIKNLASHIAGANAKASATGGGVSATEAAVIAAKVFRWRHSSNDPNPNNVHHEGSHKDPKTGQWMQNVMEGVDKDAGIMHVWMGDGWRDVYLNANIPEDDREPGINAGGGGGEERNPADYEPAEDPADVAADAGQ